MSSAPDNSKNIFHFGRFTVDVGNFSVRKDDQAVTLTPRAFDVLVFLLRNAGRAVEKQEIFDAVWKDTFVTDNALTKIVKDLRHALEDSAENPLYIETIPKRGYRFIGKVDAAGSQNVKKPSKRKFALIIGVGVLILLIPGLLFLGSIGTRPGIGDRNTPIDSIAVLPFENATRDANLEYLTDGITENIINTLSRLPELRVLPRSTVFYYKGKGEDPHTIGRALGVGAVLTGKVVQQGDTLSIQTELIDVDRKAQIWGQQYNRRLADVVDLQGEISRAIADRLSLRLNGKDREQLADRSRSTNDPEAFRLYLKGRFHLNKRTEENIRKSIEYFDQAIELDPAYAAAYAGIADAHIALSLGFSTAPTDDLFPIARSAALKALAIDDDLAEAHVSLATIKERYEWDFAAAENEYKRAIGLDPNYAEAYHRYGLFLWAMQRFEEANAKLGRARELDPLSAIIYADSGLPFYSSGQQAKAIGFFQKALEIEPEFKLAHFYLARSYSLTGKNDEAVAEAQRSFAPVEQLRPDGTRKVNSLLGIIYAMTGRKTEARAILAEMEKQTDYPLEFNSAVINAALGQNDQAFAWLEKAYQKRAGLMIQLKVNPHFDNLRDDPRYADLVRRIGLVQ